MKQGVNPRGIGFTGMGCSGKSSIGKAVAELLGWRFVEYDAFKRNEGESEKLPHEQIMKNIEQEILSSEVNFVYDGFISQTSTKSILGCIDATVKVNAPLEIRIERAKIRFQSSQNPADAHASLDDYLKQQIAYENNDDDAKLRKIDHEEWFDGLDCVKANVDGTKPIPENALAIVKRLHEKGVIQLPASLKDEDSIGFDVNKF
jgi:dephospho-CoA kinase